MIRGFHIIFSAYGFWLPNDPRGSWSQFVGAWELFRHGAARTTATRQSVAGRRHDVATRRAAKASLRFPAVRFTGQQAVVIAAGFAEAMQEGGYRMHACSILPEHVHLVLAWHERDVRRIIGHLKARATQRLAANGWVWPHSPWAEKGWSVYLNDDADIARAVAYVEENPVKEGLRRQRWRMVTAYGHGGRTAGKPAG